MAYMLADDELAPYKQEIVNAATASEAEMSRTAQRLKFADAAGAAVNQLTARERDLNEKRAALDQELQKAAERERLRAAKAIVLEEYPEYTDEQLYKQVLVEFDSQLAQADPSTDYLPRLRQAAEAGRKYLGDRTGADLDSQAWIQERISEGKGRGHEAPQMRSDSDGPNALDYVPSSQERWESGVIANMRAERLRAQGRNADGLAVEVADDEEELDA